MSLHPKIIDLTLDRSWQLLAALDHPEKRLPPVIHIAGTNGKGSTQAMIRAGLESAGKSVHAYTSPHLARFHERIRLAGELISEPHLTEILDEVSVANGGQNITYFEITTIAAMLAFARVPADFTLLEVGLGGEFDATNVIDDPHLTIITPVSVDHQQYLGETLREIATAKAGIIKSGVPCIVGPQSDEALEVIEDRAARLGAPLLVCGQHWHVYTEHDRLVFQDENGLLDLPLPALRGDHQIQNAGAAIAALRHLGCDERAITGAMKNVQWPARFQRLRFGPILDAAGSAEIWLDGGHNPAAGQALAQTMSMLPPRPTFLVCGMLKTKDVAGFLRPLARHVAALRAVTIPGETATLTAGETALAAQSVGIVATESTSAVAAVTDIAASHPNARIIICGSLYLAGHILRDHG